MATTQTPIAPDHETEDEFTDVAVRKIPIEDLEGGEEFDPLDDEDEKELEEPEDGDA